MDAQNLLIWVPVLPLLGALINLVVGRWLSKSAVTFVAIGSVLAAFAVAFYLVFIALTSQVEIGQNAQGPIYDALWKHGGLTQTVYTWLEVGAFKAQLAFRLDTLSAVMILIITFVGSLIHVYSVGYMAHDKGYTRYFGYLNLFTGAMLILVLAANMPVMFIGWEGVGLCSFLLIGFWYDNDAFATAGRKAFVVNRIGDFAFLLGMFLLYWGTKDITFTHDTVGMGSLDFANIADIPKLGSDALTKPFWLHDHFAAAAGILFFIGACGKSAQFPLYVWLPDAMAGPTPVSALIHAATMVTAGVYMVCRLSVLYAASTTALAVVAIVGLITALAAAFMAFAQTDLKKVLAYSTVSQLGFMFVAAGTGNWVAAIFHLATHAFFKACLFLGAGSVMHGMEHGGSTTPGDITTMGGLRKHMPITRITFMISCLAIAGIFPFAGFWSKDEILSGAWGVAGQGWPLWFGKLLWGGLIVAALGTAFYMWRLYFMVFSGNERSDAAKKAHESPWTMTGPLLVLALFAIGLGVIGLPHLSWFEHHEQAAEVGHFLSRWLGQSVTSVFSDGTPLREELSDSVTIGLMAGALAIGALGIAIAWMFYGRGPSPSLPKLVEGPLEPLYEASKNKLWVDELYDSVFVKPFRAVATGLFEIVDRFVIDTVAVNGAAFVVGLFGRLSRWFQNGQVQRYVAGLVVGAALVFFITAHHHHASFEYHYVDRSHLELDADTGAGLAGKATKLHWHLHGGGGCDGDADKPSDPATLVVDPDNTGARVSLCIEDPIARTMTEVTELITHDEEAKP